MKGRFDGISKKVKENNKLLLDLQKNQQKQQTAIDSISAAVDASTLEEIIPENLGIPFKTVQEIDAALKDKSHRLKLFKFASTLPKNENFASKLHDQLLDGSLMQVCFTSSAG